MNRLTTHWSLPHYSLSRVRWLSDTLLVEISKFYIPTLLDFNFWGVKYRKFVNEPQISQALIFVRFEFSLQIFADAFIYDFVRGV